jgi:hypothetical protein
MPLERHSKLMHAKPLFSKANGLDKLNELVQKKRIKVEDTSVPKRLSQTGRLKDAPGIGEVEKGGKIYINPGSTVMQGTYRYDSPVVAFSGLSPTQALASLIIHGLRHVTKDIERDDTSPTIVCFITQISQRRVSQKTNP